MLKLRLSWGCYSLSLKQSSFALRSKHTRVQGKIAKISTYDPLDLFSTQPHRVQQAVLALFQNPQNNLRLFLHGHPLQLQSDNSLEAAAAAIAAAFGPSFSAMPALQAVQALTGALQSILQQEGELSFRV